MGKAEIAWRAALAGWQIPQYILAQAPESPWGFPGGRFAPPAVTVDSLARRIAMMSLADGGTVIDVGCGAGAASLALLPAVGSIVGVDERDSMLDEFAVNCRQRNVASGVALGRWPDVADGVGPADVVVCHHVLYNVMDIVPFVRALTAHAKNRVVVEVTARHPTAFLRPFWRRFWDLDRPDGPSAHDLLAVLLEAEPALMYDIEPRPFERWGTPQDEVALVRRRLCLAASRDDEIADALAEFGRPPDALAVFAWPDFRRSPPQR